MKGFRAVAWFAAILFLPLSAVLADVIVTTDGERIECEITDQSKYKIKYLDRAGKRKSISAKKVASVEEGEPSWKEFDRRWAEVGDSIEAMIELASFASEHDLDERSGDAWDAIFKIDPDHAGARAAAGYVKDEKGKWITRAEHEKRELAKKIAKMPSFKGGNNPTTIGGESVVVVPPKGYNKNKSYPCVFLFHGNGDNAAYFLQWFIGGQQDPTYILISFENHQGFQQIKNVLPVLDEFVNYDKTRLYAIGFSGGSYTAAAAPFTFKDTFAAVAFGGGGLGGGGGRIPEAGKNAHGNYVWCGRQDPNHFPIAEESVTTLRDKGYDVVWKPFNGGHTDKAPGMIKEIFQYFGKFKLNLD
jgi:predicted esterase